MIERYTGLRMKGLWGTNEQRYRYWLRVEQLMLRARGELGQIPLEVEEHVRQHTWIDANVAYAIERWEVVVIHDLNAFVDVMRAQIILPRGQFLEVIGEERDEEFFARLKQTLDDGVDCLEANCFHEGMTSYDTEEAAMNLLYLDSCEIICKDLADLIRVLDAKAWQYKGTLMMGRTHGQHAQPITFGVKILNYLEPVRRARKNLESAMKEIQVMKLSGAVGMYGTLGPEVEEKVGQLLGFEPVIATQIISLDRRVQIIVQLAVLGGVIEKIAMDLRDMMKTEVGEAQEPFGKNQVGSSAMPHKKNPISLENICGMVRVVRASAMSMLESIATSHERDISTSSVERVDGVDAFVAMDHILRRFIKVLEGMLVFPERMIENMGLSYETWASQRLSMILQKNGLSAKRAYEIVQDACFNAMRTRTNLSEIIKEYPDAWVVLEGRPEFKNCFDPRSWVEQETFIYDREGYPTSST